jgi:predicted secreted hydrolase
MNPFGSQLSRLIPALMSCVSAATLTAADAVKPGLTADGFAVPVAGRRFEFPRDHGSHPEFRIEWWYVTGHLEDRDNARERYGFQATFFRRAAPGSAPGADRAPEGAAFAGDEIHLAHMALLEVSTGRFLHEERLNRRGWDAASDTAGLDVRNGSWSLRQLGLPVGPDSGNARRRVGMEPMQLQGGVRGEAVWNLVLTPAKPLVLFGTNGVSRKAAEASAASHYLTWSRLQTEGELTLGGRVRKVRGLAWMDHEISSSQLGEGQVGWDWACLQLDDGREVMAYRMRRADGSTDPFSTLARIEADGTVHHVDPTGFRWTAEGTWKSPRSGGVYPAGVRLEIPGGPPNGGPATVYRLRPLAADQELSGGAGGIPYWEGACEVVDDSGRKVGRAFLEMTGYAGDLGAALRPR